jgi:acyl carrier protein
VTSTPVGFRNVQLRQDMDREQLKRDLKRLIIDELDLRGHSESTIQDDAPLFGEGLGLDSLDALQLAVAIEEKFAVTIPDDERAKAIFASVSALADHLANQGAAKAPG